MIQESVILLVLFTVMNYITWCFF